MSINFIIFYSEGKLGRPQGGIFLSDLYSTDQAADLHWTRI